MSTVNNDLWTALETRAKAYVATQLLPVSWPNKEFAPPDNAPQSYLRVRFLPNQNERLYLENQGPQWRRGILQFTILTPRNKGTTNTRSIVDAICTYFPDGYVMEHNGVRVRVTMEPTEGSGFPDGSYWVVVLSIYYESFA